MPRARLPRIGGVGYDKRMDWISRTWSRLSDNILRATGLWALLPSGAVVIVTQRLAATADYLEFLGPFGWWALALLFGLITFLGYSAGALWLETRKTRAIQNRIAEESRSTDLINPLADRFYKQRLSLHDLRDPFGKMLEGKVFEDCDLIGPAAIVILCDYSGNAHSNVEFVKISNENLNEVPNKIILHGGAIRNCRIANVLFLVPELLAGDFDKGFGGKITWMN